MLYYIRRYPFSLAVVAVVIYLSFFRPPSIDGIGSIPHFDKIAHFGMYFGLSGMLWFEFLRNHRDNDSPLWHGWVGALICPVLFSGMIELCQEYFTSYRGGDWMDFLANSLGALLASLIAYYFLRPRMLRGH